MQTGAILFNPVEGYEFRSYDFFKKPYLCHIMAGLYIHIPFCKRKCVYCDFYSTAQFDRYGGGYIEAVVREMEGQKDYLGTEPLRTIYFGGGTPSLYSPTQIGRLLEAAKEVFRTENFSEVTLEANPEDLTPEYLTGLIDAGINRISIGIQSFDDGLLELMKRRHNGEKAEQAVKMAREAGFDNISIDLIYGIPGLTADLWVATLDKALALEPEHISAYHLTFEPRTTLGRWRTAGKITEVTQEESQRHFEILNAKLSSAGYEHYEVSNFALPGRRSRHNSSYWTGDKYLGIGPGAHSYNGLQRRWCGMGVAEYIPATEPVYGMETLTPDDKYNELVMTSMRCSDGLSAEAVNIKAGTKYAEYFISEAENLCSRGLLQRDGERFYIEPRNFLISDAIISSLFV